MLISNKLKSAEWDLMSGRRDRNCLDHEITCVMSEKLYYFGLNIFYSESTQTRIVCTIRSIHLVAGIEVVEFSRV